MRKIIQVTASTSCHPECEDEVIVALCDDGSAWEFDRRLDEGWVRLPDIPQDLPLPQEDD